jgi:opacity protein-like surface antigen
MAAPSRCVLALLGLVALSTMGSAQTGWTLRVEGGTTDYSSQTFSSYQSDSTELRLDGGQGFGVAAEYRPRPRIGVELSLSQIDIDADWRQTQIQLVSTNPTVLRTVTVASDSGSFSLRPLAASFLFHPTQGRLDFYLGPQLAWVDYQIDVNGPPDRDSELAYGGKVGLELALGESPWSVGANYRYLDTQHEGVERDQYTGIRLNLVSAVLSYRLGGGGN